MAWRGFVVLDGERSGVEAAAPVKGSSSGSANKVINSPKQSPQRKRLLPLMERGLSAAGGQGVGPGGTVRGQERQGPVQSHSFAAGFRRTAGSPDFMQYPPVLKSDGPNPI